jgi:metal-responsive CopG/Arc/MetJ family transcriptional regulator
MESRTRKFAISFPEEAFEQMERMRQEDGMARSAAMLEAFRAWAQQRQEQKLEAKYVQGYKKKPEKAAEVEPFFRAGLASFSQEDW